MKRIITLSLLLLVATISYSQRKVEKFKFFRMEVHMGDSGRVVDAKGLIKITEKVIVVVSNNDKPNTVFVLQKEVNPEIDEDNHQAWSAYNIDFPQTPLYIERGVGEAIRILDMENNIEAWYFSIDQEEYLDPLPEKNVWYRYSMDGSSLIKM
jgi:hypothetical protein